MLLKPVKIWSLIFIANFSGLAIADQAPGKSDPKNTNDSAKPDDFGGTCSMEKGADGKMYIVCRDSTGKIISRKPMGH